MIKSMTGYGSGSSESIDYTLSLEIRAVNGRFFEAKVRLPRSASSFEHFVKKRVKEVCRRGNISVLVGIDLNSGENGNVQFDRDAFENYRSILATIEEDYGARLDIDKVIDMRDLLQPKQDIEFDPELLKTVLEKALSQLDEMRSAEGFFLRDDLSARTTALRNYLSEIEENWKQMSSEIRKEFESKITKLLDGAEIEEVRIIQEAAILAEKLDVTEECVRCRSHLDQFEALLDSNEPVGKRMNFLLQEINRETNTIGSKSNHLGIIQKVVDMKDEVEKIKEQVQNVL